MNGPAHAPTGFNNSGFNKRLAYVLQGVAGNKKGEFEVEAQLLRKLYTNNGKFLLKILLKGTQNEAQFLKRLRFLIARDPL
jgi:hypothetical protein